MHHVAYEYLIAPETDKFEMDLSRLQRCARPYDAVFICNPNNPTGALIPGAELKALCRSCPDTFFIIDESYLPFVNEPEEASMLREGLANVVVLNSMSKIFRIPGLRIGFLIAPAAIIERMSRYRLPWSVNSVAQAAVLYLSAHGRQIEAFSKQSREFINQQKRHLARSLQGSSRLKLYPGVTPFVLARISAPGGARAVCRHLLKQHILVRNASNFEGVDETFFRFSIKSPEINARFADSLLEFLFALDSKQHHLQQISA